MYPVSFLYIVKHNMSTEDVMKTIRAMCPENQRQVVGLIDGVVGLRCATDFEYDEFMLEWGELTP
jgi:hypothetical protein